MRVKAILSGFVVAVMVLLGFGLARASFDSSNLISNGDFVAINSMSVADIQYFLQSKNSYLASFSENGRSAAQIIYDAAHGYGDASGSINGITINTSTGTVAPGVILTTLQKEQSLVTSISPSQSAINAAMGYACPDSGGCKPTYSGFTKQVENGAWQLRYNYERAEGRGFGDYQVGQSFNYGGDTGTFSNRATASLYRYTPHVYNGNYNFWNLFHNIYQFQTPQFSHSFAGQSSYVTLAQNQSNNFTLAVRNTGAQTWTQDVVHLGTSRGKDRISPFLREGDGPSGWTSPNRIKMQQSSVAPGETATFSFWMKNSGLGAGTYREYFQLVADGVGWMEDYGIYWDITVPQPTPSYAHSFLGQSSYVTLAQNQSNNFTLAVRNTGAQTWTQDVVHLGTSRGKDRISPFLREGDGPSGWTSPNRIKMQQSSVAPGETATFSFWMKNSGLGAGTYREYFQLVADGVGWMEDYGIYWDVTVR